MLLGSFQLNAAQFRVTQRSLVELACWKLFSPLVRKEGGKKHATRKHSIITMKKGRLLIKEPQMVDNCNKIGIARNFEIG